MRDMLILDSHIDTPGYIVDEGYQLAEEHRYYEADIPRLKRGKVGAVFFGVYVQPQDFPPERWLGRALEWVDAIHQEVRRNAGSMELAYTADDIERIQRSGKIAALHQSGGRTSHSRQSSRNARLLPAWGPLYDPRALPKQ